MWKRLRLPLRRGPTPPASWVLLSSACPTSSTRACTHTSCKLRAELQGGRIGKFVVQWCRSISSQESVCDLYVGVA